jgi:adenosylmethionine-8-amino-7-oxononanoate aminotransferase
LFWALEFVSDRGGRTAFAPSEGIAERVKQAAMDRGLGVYPCVGTVDGKVGDHVIVAPPYIVTDVELGEIAERLGAAVDAVFV